MPRTAARLDRRLILLLAAGAALLPFVASAAPDVDPAAEPPADPATGPVGRPAPGPPVSDQELIDQDVLDDATVTLTPDGLLVDEPVQYGPFLPLDVLDEIAGDPAGGAGGAVLPAGVGPFELHSRPGADLVIHLDFDGHTTTGTSWNTTVWNGNGPTDPIVSAPYSLDGDAGFSAQELDYIVNAWALVAEDFAPFDVDVTTEDPGPAALARTGTGDTEYGLRVVISPTSSWYGGSGGVAYLNSFWNSIDRPAFVFSNNLSGGFWKQVGEAASHEAGHGFGLLHDGVAGGTAYYRGHGDWAPIMGVGYDRPVSQWSKGEYLNADNTADDDVGRITAAVGPVPTPSTVALAAVDEVVGTITTAGGTNEFTFGLAATQQVDVTVRPTLANHDLLARLDVYDAGNTLVTSATPSDDAGWVLTVSQPFAPGTYRIVVTGIGWLDPLTTGFSDYASLGRFELDFDATGAGTTTTTSTTSTTTTSTTTTSTSTSTTSTLPPSTTTTTEPDDGRTTTTTAPPTTTTTSTTTSTSTTTTSTTEPPPTSTTTTTTEPPPTSSSTTSTTTTSTSTTSTTTTSTTSTTTTTEPPPTGSSTTSTSTTTPPPTSTTTPPPTSPTTATTATTVPPTPGPEPGARLTAIASTRLLDTRSGDGGSTRLAAGQTIVLDVTGHRAVPGSATAAVLNAVAVDPASDGFLSLTTCDPGVPSTSNVNYRAGRTTANSSIVTLTDAGTICIFSSAASDVVVDVTAWLGDGGESALGLVPATRVVDSRDGTGGVERLFPGRPAVVDLRDHIDPAAAAAAVNITVTGAAGTGFVAAFPCVEGWDGNSSALNFGAVESRANNAILALDAARTFCVTASTATDIVVDLVGEFGPRGLTYLERDAIRVLDTRRGGPLVAAGTEVAFPVPRPPGTTTTPPAASVVVTAVDHTIGGFVTSWSCGARPDTSTLNPLPFEANANGAIVPLSGAATTCLYTSNPTNLLVDLSGWWI